MFCSFDGLTSIVASEGRTLNETELKYIFDIAMLRTDYMDARRVLAVWGRDFTRAEHERLIQTRVEKCGYALAAHAAEQAGRKLTQEETDKAVLADLQIFKDTMSVVRAVSAGVVSVKTIEQLAETCLELALPSTAGFLAEKIGRRFSDAEIETVRNACEELGFPERLFEIEKLPRVEEPVTA